MIQPREVQRPTHVPTSYERGPDWREDALCAQTGGDDHHPLDGDRAAAQRAKKICQACTVTAECLAWALEHDQRFGVWGGTTERERRDMRRAHKRAQKEESA
jgi:WhiB family redox-sensing transcriptional regulator